MTYEMAASIAALRGADYRVADTLGVFGLPQYVVIKRTKRRIGKGSLPNRVLIKSLNTYYASLPRAKEWHKVANGVVSGMSQGMLAKSTYAVMARSIKWKVDQTKSIKKKPTIATIENWLKTYKSVDSSVLNFRNIRQKSRVFSG
jgi:hypothetical protein